MLLPLLLVVGGMTIWSTNDSEVETRYVQSKASAGMHGWRGSQNAHKKTAR
jgi:hypothetical protein